MALLADLEKQVTDLAAITSSVGADEVGEVWFKKKSQAEKCSREKAATLKTYCMKEYWCGENHVKKAGQCKKKSEYSKDKYKQDDGEEE